MTHTGAGQGSGSGVGRGEVIVLSLESLVGRVSRMYMLLLCMYCMAFDSDIQQILLQSYCCVNAASRCMTSHSRRHIYLHILHYHMGGGKS